jgi:uncharacterized protein (DUF1330 family)
MTDPNEVEQFNPEAFKAFAAAAAKGPVVMLNLLAFKPDGGGERYGEYAAAVAPLLAGVGGRIVSVHRPAPTMIGTEDWDMIALVEYPTRQAFLDMISSPEYQKVMHIRTEALVRAGLVPMDPE